jgi:hypothetical protein
LPCLSQKKIVQFLRLGWLLNLALFGILALAIIGMGITAFVTSLGEGFQTVLKYPPIASGVSQIENYFIQLATGALH